MKYYYGFAVIVQLLFALRVGDKTKSAYMSYLARELFGAKPDKAKIKRQPVNEMPESTLRPVRD